VWGRRENLTKEPTKFIKKRHKAESKQTFDFLLLKKHIHHQLCQALFKNETKRTSPKCQPPKTPQPKSKTPKKMGKKKKKKNCQSEPQP
jgi:hypothetical protein